MSGLLETMERCQCEANESYWKHQLDVFDRTFDLLAEEFKERPEGAGDSNGVTAKLSTLTLEQRKDKIEYLLEELTELVEVAEDSETYSGITIFSALGAKAELCHRVIYAETRVFGEKADCLGLILCLIAARSRRGCI